MDPEHQEVIAQFCGITGASASSAQSALTAAEWDIEAAISLYYAASDGQPEEPDEPEETTVPAPTPQPPRAQPAASSSSSRAPKNNSKLRTLRDLQSSANDDDEDEEKDQDMFAGGEKSGLAVQNPGSGPTDHFRNILNQARQNRDRPSAPEEEEAARPSHFTGRAQTLGGDDAPSRVVEDPTARRGPPRLERITRTLHLWVDGVSVDDGPLFRFDDPANRHIMDQINRGQAPLSLLDVQPNQEVDLNLEPHKDQEYVQPKKKYKAFSGSGQRLGSPVPGVAASQPPPQPSLQHAAAPSSSTPTVQVDEAAPVLSLQIRLGDGSRLTSKFNTSHTIGDVYDFVDASSASQRAYVLATTFPTQEMSDRAQILGDLKGFQKGGVLVQKFV